MNHARMRRPLVTPIVAFLLLGMAAAGCSDGDPEEGTVPQGTAPQLFSSGQICSGLFSGEGGKALEKVLGSTEFRLDEEAETPDVRAVAQVMESAYRAGRKITDAPQPTCSVLGAEGSRLPRVRLMFTAYSKHAALPGDLPGAGVGEVQVSTGVRHVMLTFDCVSSRVGSTQDIPLQITLEFRARSGEGDPAVPAQADLTITHSAALAVAKELGCASDGWLPAAAEGLPKPGGAVGVAPGASPGPGL